MIRDSLDEGNGARTRFETSWLIVRDAAGCGSPEILTLGPGIEGDGKVLPIFSFEEEALLFLRFCEFEGGWRVGKIGISDLVSALADARPEVRQVALDPIPEIGPYGPHDLVSVPRETFVGMLDAHTRCVATGHATIRRFRYP